MRLLGRGDYYLSPRTRWIDAVLYPGYLLFICDCASALVGGGGGEGIGLITIVLDKRFRLWIYLDAHRGTSFAEGHFSGAFRASRFPKISLRNIYTRERYNMHIPSVKNPRACAPFVFIIFFFFPPRSVHRTFHFASLENTNPSIHPINSTQCNQSINQSIEYMYQTPRSKTSSEREKRGRKRKIHSNTAFPNQPARQPLTYRPLKLHLTSPDSR